MAKASAPETVRGILNVVEVFSTLTVENGKAIAKSLLEFLNGRYFSLVIFRDGRRDVRATQYLVPVNSNDSPEGVRVISLEDNGYKPLLYIRTNTGLFVVKSNVQEGVKARFATLPFLIVGEETWAIVDSGELQIAFILEGSK